jgi:hypothetical protein
LIDTLQKGLVKENQGAALGILELVQYWHFGASPRLDDFLRDAGSRIEPIFFGSFLFAD